MNIKDLVSDYNFEIISGKNKFDTQINSYGLNRAGLELTGYFVKAADKKNKRVVLLSSKENSYVTQFDKELKAKKYFDLMNSGTPVIIITQKFTDPVLVEVAKKLDFPLLRTTGESTTQIIRKILDVFDKYFSPSIEEHATLLNIFGKGVLIKGRSGIGKSEVSLELVKNNHLFIGDDRIILTNKSNKIFGQAHPILKNLIEVRGIGIFDIAKASGYQVIMQESVVDLVIELVDFEKDKVDQTERIGIEHKKINILGVDVKYIQIPVSAGRSLANIIESAVSQFKINQSEQAEDIIDVLKQRTNQYLKGSK
ncbi:HPr(Ser) kinase/phosphatase [Mycoplasma putrefaciens]|nr:HPr(Ser) kinase/phosphatase [Mycoplasma putrefaciens]